MSDFEMRNIVNFFFETGMLQRLKRSGNDFLGSGDQTVGSHIFRTTIIGYVLSEMAGLDTGKVMMMCMLHDIEESRTGDLNYLQQRYVKSDDKKALNDVLKGLPMKNKILGTIEEFEALETPEASISKDADTLELILYLKEEQDKGNPQAVDWIYYAKKRLLNDIAIELAAEIEIVPYNEWWMSLTDEWEKGSKSW